MNPPDAIPDSTFGIAQPQLIAPTTSKAPQSTPSPAPPLQSVRTLLVWLVLACLLPGVIGAGFLFAYEYREGRAQLEKGTLQTTRALTQTIDSHLLKAQAVAQSLAASDWLLGGDLARFHRQASEAVALVGAGTRLILRNTAGRSVVDTAMKFGLPLSDEAPPDQVRDVLATDQPTGFDVIVGTVPSMNVNVPVIIGGKLAYALSIVILPAQFNALLKAQRLPADWVAVVIDRSGTVAGRTLAPEQFVGHKAATKLLQRMTGSTEGFLEATTLEGTPMLSFYSRSPVTNWTTAIGIPRQSLIGELMHNLAMLALGIAALFGVGLTLAWFMGGRIARSVQALIAPANALGSAAWVPVLPVHVHFKEAAEVAQSLSRAAALLNKRAATLQTSAFELAEAHRIAKFGTWNWDLVNGEVTTAESIPAIFGHEVPSFPAQRGTLLPVESWERLNAAAQHAIQTGEGYDLELPFNHGGGHLIWIHSICEATRNEQGEVIALSGAIQDITERRAAENAAWQSQQLLKSTMDNFPTFIAFKDAAGRFLEINGAVAEALGHPKSQICGRTIADFVPQAAAAVHWQHELEVMESRRAIQFEETTPLPTGLMHFIVTSFPLIDAEGKVYGTGHIAHDISEHKRAEERLREASLHDSLTGLPNRACVFEYGGHLLAAAKRRHGRGALLFIDLDRFKPINDLYGHEIGDRVLQEVAKRLGDCTRDEDLVGRLGGDEFVVILPNADALSHRAAVVAQHIVDSISRPMLIDTLELSLSPSIGVSYFPDDAGDVGALIHNADLAMYQAKQSGRANYQTFTPELNSRVAQAHRLEVQLKQALKHGEGLALHYQPVIDIASRELIAVEALVRLAQGEGDGRTETSGPEVFIPIAESTGLIIELGEWVAIEACRQHALWRDQGLQTAIAINVSPLQFRQRSFVARLKSIIADSGMDPACLEIEVTESAVMDSVAEAIEILQRIKSLGIKVAMDDFGTGYSSLSSLSSFPLDKLKVDQSFVRRIEDDPASRVVTDAIIALGHSLKLNVLAEGIESRNSLRYLKEHGCNQAQGFFFSRPLPAAEFLPWAQKHRSLTQARREGRTRTTVARPMESPGG